MFFSKSFYEYGPYKRIYLFDLTKMKTIFFFQVLQCHEDELTNLVSTMSDGWKFEQLINIGKLGRSLHQ